MIITAKRSIITFFIIAVLSASVLMRIAYISNTIASEADSQKSSRVLSVGYTRGMIYDRNMLPLVNREMHTMLVINPTADAMECLQTQLDEESFENVKKLASDGNPFLFQYDGYDGDCDDIVDVIVYDRYSENDNAVHLIGYLDDAGHGVSGIEKAFDELLLENSGTVSVRYNANSSGRMLSGMGFEITDENYDSKGGLVLTIDREIQRVCENAMKQNNIDKGAVVVLDSETSEIVAMASTPVFDRANLEVSLSDDRAPFLNRVLNSYAVGSVFKPVVSAAALEKGIADDTLFECNGYSMVSGVRFNCHNLSGHGELNMTEAMAVSCNSYFIQLGQRVLAEGIVETASALGFGKETVLCDGMIADNGYLTSTEEIDSMPALANFSFGQGTLLATPVQIAAVYCAFANGGYYREPYVLKSIIDINGDEVAYYKNEIDNKVLTESVCNKIEKMLAETVLNGSGKLASPMEYNAAGKTATAETGQKNDGREIVHTWFAGYYPYEQPKYVIVVFREDGKSAASDCAPVFRDIADSIKLQNEFDFE